MNALESGQSALLTQFRDFYREVIRLKQMVKSGTWVAAPTRGTEEGPDRAMAATAVWQRLLSVLEQQALAARLGAWEYGSEVFKEAQYIMAALADEIFVHLEWGGKETWNANLLEAKLFGSHVAGTQFFQRLDRLLQNRDPVYTELAAVYLMALSLGFRGKFWGLDDRGQLNHYRRLLFSFIFRRDPDLLNASKRLFPEAYAYTLEEESGRRLPDPRKWIVMVVLLLVVMGVLSHVVWNHLTADLDRVVQQIFGLR
ncbi:MAG: DotU family type IV/VI secretion system protein [Nitrospinae bacterium]|nr:DotU family type IV/VI secretion system protein [Nitrospinota bacterium]